MDFLISLLLVVFVGTFLVKTFLRLVVGAVAPAPRCSACGASPRRDPANGTVYATCRKCGHVTVAPAKAATPAPKPFVVSPFERELVYRQRGTVDPGGTLTLTAKEAKRIRTERTNIA